ncbi:MAG TPA: efflux RND transporter permease subunit, partial [Candidatus Paceibacterota bacterium]|nr:efflux RND transporter permease subunit [Candidatus Paceibacterota bacterium]
MKASDEKSSGAHLGIAGRIAQSFIDSKLTLLIVIASLLLGVFAVVMLPREEEPQIKVPMVDVLVTMPGSGAKEVEQRVTRPMEKLLWEIPGVEYIYSTSSEGQSLVIVRFKVGEDMQTSLVRLNQKLQSNYDKIPHGVSPPLIKAWSIDDVPILCLTFHSAQYGHLTLRRLVAQVDDSVKQVHDVAGTTIIGGAHRQIRVLLDPAKLAARNLSPAGLVPMLQQADRQYVAGELTSNNKEVVLETGAFLQNAEDVGDVVVGVYGGRPVYLRDVAAIEDGAEEPTQYVLFGSGAPARSAGVSPAGPGGVRAASGNTEPGISMNPQAGSLRYQEQPVVTLAIAKRPGANAIQVADQVLKKVDTLKGRIIPADVQVTVTRNYGETAQEKSNELLFHMLLAVVGVSVLILLALGWRESLIVAVAIPTTLALTLLVFYLYGFTLNRITLFAL